MQGPLIPRRRTTLWLALAVAIPFSAFGLELGELEVSSALGERLDARIPLRPLEGEWFHASCLTLRDATTPGLASIPGGQIAVERRRSGAQLRLRSAEPVREPALGFALSSSCAGAAFPTAREYSILLDPPRVTGSQRPVGAPSPAAATRTAGTTRTAPAEPVREASAGSALPSVARAVSVEPASNLGSASSRLPPSAPVPPVAPPSAIATGSPETPRFLLRLSSAPIDLSRARQFDEKSRSALRERLRLLDNDDQVATMLSMRDNLRQLEARVAELQLKLAQMPSSLSRAAPPSVPVSAPSPPVLPKGEPTAAAPKAEGASTGSTPLVREPAAGSSFPPAIVVAPQPTPAKATTPAAPPEVKAAPTPAAKGAPTEVAGGTLPAGIAAWAAGLAVLFLLAAAWFWRRRRSSSTSEDWSGSGDAPSTEIAAAALVDELPIEVAAPVRVEVATDASLATRLDEDTEALRRRYIEERFPEIRNRAIVLDDPASVVKGARLFYEDGAIPRAVELLRFAIEDRPDELRPWLALFEMYRLERLSGEYGELAARFRDRHAGTVEWGKVRYLGRELDASNPIYQDPPIDSLETIGPHTARRVPPVHVDPVAENWLQAPMDFENEVLATALRRSLMARDRVDDRDLAPNPMPALRNVEMFSVG